FLRTRTMLLEPLLVFARRCCLLALSVRRIKAFPNSFNDLFQKPIRPEKYLSQPAFGGLTQAPPLFLQQLQFASVSFQLEQLLFQRRDMVVRFRQFTVTDF